MLTNLINLDSVITKYLSNLVPHTLLSNSFFSFFSLKGGSILIWILVIIIVALLEERKNPGLSRRDKKFLILFSLAFLLTGLVSDIILKNIFMRSRPLSSIIYNLGSISPCPLDFSFPSAHAATAFAAATILTFFDKKHRWFYFLVAILISYSRIFLGCHYFFDVVAGGLIGYFISKLLLKLNRGSA